MTDQPADLDRLRRAYADYDRTGRDWFAHELAAELPALIGEVERLRAALTLIGTDCANYTADFTCITAGRTRDGQFGASRWCDQCIARNALDVA